MNDDRRCCGTGTCIINAHGQCWCGQQWDGEKMCFQPLMTQNVTLSEGEAADSIPTQSPPSPH